MLDSDNLISILVYAIV